MKKSLLAGCAAVAFVATCGSALADTAPGKFDIKLSGDASFTAGYVSQNYDTVQGNGSNVDFVNRFRLQVTPQATANNGMQYGAQLRVRAWRGDGMVDVDQAYIFLDGQYGRVEAGVNAGLNSQYGVTAPSGFGTGGVVGDWTDGPTSTNAGGQTWLTEQNTYLAGTFGGEYNTITNNNPSTKLQYFTPRFFAQDTGSTDDSAPPTGLMGMLGYTPQNLSVNTGVSRASGASQSFGLLNGGAAQAGGSLANPGDSFCQYAYFTSTSAQGCAWRDVVETGLRYDGSFRGVSVSGSFGYMHGSASSVNSRTAGAVTATNPYYANGFYNLNAYQAGLQLGYAGFLVGGSYINAGKSGYTRNSFVYRNGVSTTVQNTTEQSSFTAGISYETGPVVVGFNYAHGQDAGDLTLPGKRNADLFAVGATYTLAPGLTTSLEYLRSLTYNQAGFNLGTADYVASNSGNASSNAHMFLWKNVITF